MASHLASFLIRVVGRGAAKRFEAATCDPVAVQQAKLREILERNRNTEYGKEHGFASIRTLQDFQKSVPIVTYDQIRSRVERVCRGERNILTAEDPILFART